MSLSKQATQMPMFAGFPHLCKRGAKTPIKAPTKMIPQRDAKKFLIAVIDYPPFLKSGLDCRQFVADNGQEGVKKCIEELRAQEDKNKIRTPLFSLSFF
jgi:hypothetical protein